MEGLFGIDAFGVIIAIFVGVNLLYKELDLKTVYTILPKPLHRWEFVLGKWLGMLLTLAVQMGVMGLVLGVTLAMALVSGVVYGGLRLLSDVTSRSAEPVYTPPPPLLPGAPVVVVPPKQPAATVSGVGYDVSYPQCGRTPPKRAAFGIVGVNEWRPLKAEIPFGGVKQSGMGAEGGEEGMREFLETRVISMPRPGIEG